MRKFILFFLFCSLVIQVFSQKPAWTSYDGRNEIYPEQMYIVGFASDMNTDSENEEKFLAKLADYARVQVIQTVQVQIESKVTNDMVIRNGDVDQKFQQSSVSLATAEIAGLEYKRYFDTETNTGYAIAYAERRQLISYYKEKLNSKLSQIPQKISQAEQLMGNDDKQGALKSYYECMPIFTEIDEAQALLVALGIKANGLRLQEVADYKTKVRMGISKLQSANDLTLSQLAYFLAYGLHLQTGEVKNQVYVGDLTFQDTEMQSDFSKRFKKEFQQNLVKEGKYKTQEGTYEAAASKKGFYSNYFVDGTYWEESGKLKVIVLMRDSKNGKAKASAEASISLDWLKKNSVDHIPGAIEKIEKMAEIQFKTDSPNYEVKVTEVAKKPLTVQTLVSETPTERIPVRFKVLADGEEIANEWSNTSGVAAAILSKAKPSTKTLVVVAELNVAAYLGLDERSNYAKKISETRSIPQVKFFVKILGPSAYFELKEIDLFSRRMQVPFIEPKLKEALTEKGYTFSDNASQADLMITINAKARRGNNVSGIYFAFVDATVSVLDLGSGKEIYKNSYTDIKGGSGNWERANAKAYQAASKKIVGEIVEEIMKKH